MEKMRVALTKDDEKPAKAEEEESARPSGVPSPAG